MTTGKYAPLEDHLRAQTTAHVPMRFAEIEHLIGAPLPASARKHRPWWSNNPSNSVITHAWLKAGFKTECVDMERETLLFRRRAGETPPEPSRTKGGVPPAPVGGDPLSGLYGGLRGTVIIPEGVDLTQPVWDFDWSGD